jgi:uncharacterized repeat protein (TIGR03803 family)
MRACGVFLLWSTAAIALPAQTFTTLHSFNGTDGLSPYGGLVLATNGNFYGTTVRGGTAGECMHDLGCGTVFKITPSGVLTTLHSFDNTDGAFPDAGPVQATNGNFYGTTNEGGTNGYGTVFKITPSGVLTALHSFDNTDGAFPYGGLVQGTDRNFYGTTYGGGPTNSGTAFKITPRGVLTTLHSFDYTHGANPYAGLIQATNGRFYGETGVGGANGGGTVFSLSMGLK